MTELERQWVQNTIANRYYGAGRKYSASLAINKAGQGELIFYKETEKRSYRDSIKLTKGEMLNLSKFINRELQNIGDSTPKGD